MVLSLEKNWPQIDQNISSKKTPFWFLEENLQTKNLLKMILQSKRRPKNILLPIGIKHLSYNGNYLNKIINLSEFNASNVSALALPIAYFPNKQFVEKLLSSGGNYQAFDYTDPFTIHSFLPSKFRAAHAPKEFDQRLSIKTVREKNQLVRLCEKETFELNYARTLDIETKVDFKISELEFLNLISPYSYIQIRSSD